MIFNLPTKWETWVFLFDPFSLRYPFRKRPIYTRGIPAHGPQKWPWWRLFALSHVKISVSSPSTGHRLWLYTRWGACHWDLTCDRRSK